jgi:hypothetical protein
MRCFSSPRNCVYSWVFADFTGRFMIASQFLQQSAEDLPTICSPNSATGCRRISPRAISWTRIFAVINRDTIILFVRGIPPTFMQP